MLLFLLYFFNQIKPALLSIRYFFYIYKFLKNIQKIVLYSIV